MTRTTEIGIADREETLVLALRKANTKSHQVGLEMEPTGRKEEGQRAAGDGQWRGMKEAGFN